MAKKKNSRLVDMETLGFQAREAYKTARTNIVYAIIKKGCKKIVFTSANKGEGKSITAMNISYALAQQVDTKVLLVECDLRRPHVHSSLGISPTPGLVNYLNNECDAKDIIKSTKEENLSAICFGAIPPNPSELLASDAMMNFIKDMEEKYDFIIFDAPPVGVVVDAIPVIEASDGAVLVVKNESTTYPEFNRTVDVIKRSNSKILGVIVNKVKTTDTKKSGKYNSYYGYY